ncbi:hypothetical protein PHJA_001904700 [Phtheirospermum japonicum]|uniref:Uncharacterized protein n=1 Tax=Phtheirospermum japonicum TaxID=374723 RepID=A0A830CEH2_9LAMI|nr:hypothetical protein PHJA_001904700 [Phtheirospermum japonicum]
MARGLMITFIVLACALEAAHRADGQSQVGQCLVGCGQKLVSCAIGCGTGGGGIGALTCFQSCGTGNTGCVTSCFRTHALPKPKLIS